MTDLAGVPVSETAFTYDAVGNRLTKTTTLGTDPPATTTYTYNGADQLLAEGGVTYTYDLAGRLTSRTDASGTTTYQYDVENRLTRVVTPSGTITHTYDADGNRVATTDAAGTRRYLVDPNRALAQVLAEYTPTGTLLASYVYATDLLSLIRGGLPAFYHADGLGSSRLLTEVGGTLTDTYDYDAFGVLITRTGTTENRLLFTGQQLETTQALYYLRARYYEPRTGRFLSRDPHCEDAATPLRLHKYRYADGDPVNNTDPSGLYAERLSDLVVATALLGTLSLVARPIDLPGIRSESDDSSCDDRRWIETVGVPSEPMPTPDLSNTPERCRLDYAFCMDSANRACGKLTRATKKTWCWTKFVLCLVTVALENLE